MATDIEELRNDLHRHQDQDREDFRSVRQDIALSRAETASNLITVRAEIGSVRETVKEFSGGLKILRVIALTTIPSALAAAGAAIFDLIHHW